VQNNFQDHLKILPFTFTASCCSFLTIFWIATAFKECKFASSQIIFHGIYGIPVLLPDDDLYKKPKHVAVVLYVTHKLLFSMPEN
jgi:hypothetical protein